MTSIDTSFGFNFPAIRGLQANSEYYVCMCPLKFIPKLFSNTDEDLKPNLRSQRVLNQKRIPSITRYILDNPNSYIFSAITASVDGDVVFDSEVRAEDTEDTEDVVKQTGFGLEATAAVIALLGVAVISCLAFAKKNQMQA